MQLTSKILSLRHLPVLAGLLTAATIISATWFISVSEDRRQAQTERLDILNQMSTVRARLEGALNSRLSLSKAIVSYIAIHGEINHETFESLAEGLVARDNMIRNVSLLKNTEIVDVCPLEGNERAIGVDLATIPGQRETVQRAIETRQAVIAGPVNLVQGGIGIASRIPIFVTPKGGIFGSGAYWGQVSVVIMQDVLFKDTGIVDPSSGLKYGLRGKDGLGAEGAIFWGDETVFQSSPVVLDVMLPGGTWQMAAMPAAGWGSQSTSSLWFYAVGGFLAMFAGWMIWLLLVTKTTLQQRLILERSLMEKAQESEATLRTVLQTTPIGIGLCVNRRFVWTNEFLSQMTGYSAADLLGQNSRMLYESDEEFDRIGTVCLQPIEAGGAGSLETHWKCKDGSVIDVYLSSSAVAPGDLSRGVVFSATDITERKRSEQNLRESEERMRLLIESAPIPIRIATQGRYSYVNTAFLNMFGYGSPEEIEGLPVEALYVEEDRCLITERNENRARGLGVDPHYRVTGIRKDGARIDLEAWGSEISYQGQRSTFRFLIDVTEANSLRAQLLQAQKMEAVGTLAGGIAHDFNNLLQAVLGYSDFMLQRKKEGEPDYTDLQKIYNAGQRGADLVKRLMTFSRKLETKIVPVDLNQEISQVQQLLSQTIPKTIKIDAHLSGDLESVNADQSQISQVLMNLGVNARDAMPHGGTLTMETANVQLDKDYCDSHLAVIPGSYVLLTVSDTGQGMDKKTLSHIFEPFFTTKERGKGTGLGLATVYGIVKQHDGHIMCYSELGYGTTFRIYLPAIQTKNDLETPTLETAIPGGTETVLLVDDEEDIRDLGATLLNEFGYKAILASNGKEALEIYQREGVSISLIILDLIMPVMDGRQCLAEILRMAPNTKVIIASGYSESGQAGSAVAAGAKGFVQKPYNMRQLLTKIREILDKD